MVPVELRTLPLSAHLHGFPGREVSADLLGGLPIAGGALPRLACSTRRRAPRPRSPPPAGRGIPERGHAAILRTKVAQFDDLPRLCWGKAMAESELNCFAVTIPLSGHVARPIPLHSIRYLGTARRAADEDPRNRRIAGFPRYRFTGVGCNNAP